MHHSFFLRSAARFQMSFNFQKLLPKFESILGSVEYVKVSKGFCEQYSHDESHFLPHNPDIVLLPDSVAQVSDIMKVCNEFKVPVIPFGTGTGIEGGVVPLKGGVCLDLKRMNQITDINETDFDCRVEPGVTRKNLNESIRNTGLWFTVDPGANASICGMIATSASGTTSVRYGTMKSNVKNLEVVLADGSIIHTRGKGRRPWKSSAGYNLTDLFIGSEGTLGIITSAIVGLHARPSVISVAVCNFPDVQSAIDTVVSIRQLSIPLARIEFLDVHQIKACNLFNRSNMDELPTLFLEFNGSSVLAVDDQLQSVREICESNSCKKFDFSNDRAGIDKLWKARHNAYYAVLAMRTNCRNFTTDVCVPISELSRVICDCRLYIDESGLFGAILGHVGDGNFHCIFPTYEEDKSEAEIIQKLSDKIVKRALLAGGTCTGEHGVGIGKISYLEEEFGPQTLELMKTLKQTLDPNNILNPGKVFA